MTGRASVFSDSRIIELLNEHFVPVADNCSPLQTGRGEDGQFFKKIAEQGHYAGRTFPTATRQGLYAATAEGELLASINSTSADRVLSMIQRAVTAWADHPSNTGRRSEPLSRDEAVMQHPHFPQDGLVLKMYVRDLPRENQDQPDSRHNFDYVWITRDEVLQFTPAEVRVGEKFPVPSGVLRRLARCHLVDTVRGECPAWRVEHIKTSQAQLTIESIEGTRVRLRLEGQIQLVAQPDQAANPYSQRTVDRERGIDARLLGYLTFDQAERRIEAFRLIATGPRWGAYVYNGRSRDPGPAPIGFAFEIAPNDRAAWSTPPMALRAEYFGE